MPSPFENSLAGTLAPMLFAFAIFSLGVLNFTRTYKVIVDEIFTLLAAFSIFAAALLVDSILDKQSLNFYERVNYLGLGYISFCIIVGMITISVPLLYLVKIRRGTFRWRLSFLSFLSFVGAGVSVMAKMLTLTNSHLWAIFHVCLFCSKHSRGRAEPVTSAGRRQWLARIARASRRRRQRAVSGPSERSRPNG